ncbi:MAG TPA: DUF4398 domain-containing protein [Vicinamibacterales bacterium]|jgi:hypothetical protein
MSSVPSRALVMLSLCLTLIVLPACGQPPEKELHEAQGALDAARAAGAPQYAADEYQAAADALKKAQTAVTDRDYRQALNFALDSRERAQDAVKDAADRKAAVRGDAERALVEGRAALEQARAVLADAEAAHTPAKLLAAPRATIDQATDALQKARTALDAHQELKALDLASGIAGRLKATTQDLQALLAHRRRPR